MKKIIVTAFLCVCVSFAFADDSRADTLATIESFTQLGDFHAINYVGDYEYILDFLDNLFLDGDERIDEMGCSLFSGLGDADNIFLGRNFDNPQQDVLVGKYAAPGCYKNIAINRLADMGLTLGTNFSNLSPQQELLLLRAPYFACDGINEMGLAVGVAYVDAVPVTVDPNKETIWLTRWLREILDHAANVQEAIDITNSYNILDNFFGQNTIAHHLLITDNSGTSVILEYHDGAFEEIYPEVDWQVLTNTHIYNHTLQQMFNLCYRYELLYDALEDQNGEIYDWRNGMDILALPTWGNLSNGTQWSSVYDVNENFMYLSTYRDFDNIARVDIENFEFLNFGNFYLDDFYFQESNGNGIIEPGEWVYLVTDIMADFLSTGVNVQLSCEETAIEITSGYYSFGDLLPEQASANSTQPFSFNVSENIGVQQIEILMQISTDYGHEFELVIPLEISGVEADDNTIDLGKVNLQNYPNPFNPSTEISFQISDFSVSKSIELGIYNLKGQKVRTFPVILSGVEESEENEYSVNWNGKDDQTKPVSSGIYYCVLKSNNKNLAVRKMILMK